jgi:hypothetical protein
VRHLAERDLEIEAMKEISAKKNGALPFERIRSQYREEAQAYIRFDVPNEEITEQALQRILLGLVAERAIVHSEGSGS